MKIVSRGMQVFIERNLRSKRDATRPRPRYTYESLDAYRRSRNVRAVTFRNVTRERREPPLRERGMTQAKRYSVIGKVICIAKRALAGRECSRANDDSLFLARARTLVNSFLLPLPRAEFTVVSFTEREDNARRARVRRSSRTSTRYTISYGDRSRHGCVRHDDERAILFVLRRASPVSLTISLHFSIYSRARRTSRCDLLCRTP